MPRVPTRSVNPKVQKQIDAHKRQARKLELDGEEELEQTDHTGEDDEETEEDETPLLISQQDGRVSIYRNVNVNNNDLKTLPELVKYWRECNELAANDPRSPKRQKVSVYCYRLWPLCDLTRIGIDYKYLKVWNNECPFTVEDCEEQLLEMFGSGEYRFNVMDCEQGSRPFEIARIWKYTTHSEAHPPRIILDTLVISSKNNKDFVRDLRMKGVLLPGDAGYRSEAERKTEKVSSDLTDKIVNKAMDKFLDEKEESRPVVNNASDIVTAATALSSSFNAAAQASIDLVQKQADKVLENQASQTDPFEMIERVSKLIPDSSKTIEMVMTMNRESNERIEQMRNREIESIREEAKRDRQEMKELLKSLMTQQQTSTQSRNDEGDETDRLIRMLEKKQRLDELTGVGPKRNTQPMQIEEKGTDWGAIIQTALTSLPQVLAQLQQGQLMNQQAQQQQQNATQQNSVSAVAGGTPTQAQTQQAATQAAQTQTTSQPKYPHGFRPESITEITGGQQRAMALFNMYTVALNMIADPLCKYVITAYKGEEEDKAEHAGEFFAGWVIDGYTRAMYDSAKSNGKDALYDAIRTHAGIMSRLDAAGITAEQLKEFIQRFCEADTILAEEDQEPVPSVDEVSTTKKKEKVLH